MPRTPGLCSHIHTCVCVNVQHTHTATHTPLLYTHGLFAQGVDTAASDDIMCLQWFPGDPETNTQRDTQPCKSLPAIHLVLRPKAQRSCLFDLRKYTFSLLIGHCAWGPSQTGYTQASSLFMSACSHCTKMTTCFAYIPISTRRTLRLGRELCLTSHQVKGLALSRFPATISSGNMHT